MPTAREANIANRVNTVSPAEYLDYVLELSKAERDIMKATDESAKTRAALSAARGVKSGIIKRAEKAGADIEAMQSVASLRAMEDTARNKFLETVFTYARWENVPLWISPSTEKPQGALFADDPEAAERQQGLIDARVDIDAHNSRQVGGSLDDNPYAAGSRDHQTWARGWKDADAEMGGAPPKPKVASDERRPAKAADGEAAPKRGRGRPGTTPAAIAKEAADIADEIGTPVGSA